MAVNLLPPKNIIFLVGNTLAVFMTIQTSLKDTAQTVFVYFKLNFRVL